MLDTGSVICAFCWLREFLVIWVGHESKMAELVNCWVGDIICGGMEGAEKDILSKSYEDFLHGKVSVPLGYALEFTYVDLLEYCMLVLLLEKVDPVNSFAASLPLNRPSNQTINKKITDHELGLPHITVLIDTRKVDPGDKLNGRRLIRVAIPAVDAQRVYAVFMDGLHPHRPSISKRFPLSFFR